MAISTKEIYSTLNDLIQTCRDGEQGFREAAEGIGGEETRRLFLDYAQQRARFAGELQALVSKLGGHPAEGGSVGGAVHRGWINIKQAVTGKDRGAIIAEAERGEDTAVDAYRKALEKDLPGDVRETVERQYKQVLEAHNRVRDMELSMRGGSTRRDW